jgi:uncharacterized protein involved in type VI secretion and phage assembly
VPITLYESGGGAEDRQPDAGTSVVTGQVVNNCDRIAQGKVLVRIPSLSQEVWARLAAIGGGAGAGFLYTPRVDDAVLVALNQDEPNDAFVLGGLWSSNDSPPASADDATSKRVIKSGLKGQPGHEIELDDLRKSIRIVTATRQRITIEQTKIEISNDDGTLLMRLDNGGPTITVQGANVEIKGTTSLKLEAPTVDIASTAGAITIAAKTLCKVSGTRVEIN